MSAQDRTQGTVIGNPAAERRYYHPTQKDYATFLETSEETGGEYTRIEVEVAPGGGTTPTTTRPTPSTSRWSAASWT